MSLQQEPELVLVEEPGQVLALAQVPVGALIAVLAQGLGRA